MSIRSKIARHLQRSTTFLHLLQIQSLLLKIALDRDPFIISEFISSSCSVSMDYARCIFDSLSPSLPLLSWNLMIRAHANSPNPAEAVALFSELQRTGNQPDNLSFPFALKACGRSSLLGQGMAVHCLASKVGFISDSFVGNSLLHMYAACGAIGVARQVFDEMADRDVVSWSSLIGGYVSCKRPHEAVMVFQQMIRTVVKPNSVTMVSLLSACTLLESLCSGKAIHSYITINAFELDVALGTALVAMYSKCGDIEKAFQVFNSMNVKNLQSWTVMISAFADHGHAEDVISLFKQMESSGIKPDNASMTSLLCACSHLGMVDEGRQYFCQMISVYNIQPRMEHYGCMVDLFGRAGLVEEAYCLLTKMPMQPNSVILRSFLGACRNHGRAVQVDKDLMKLLIEIEPELGANYVIASNVSAVSAQWTDVAQIRGKMMKRGLKKVSGCSWMEVYDKNVSH